MFVAGAVGRPGLYRVRSGDRAGDAIRPAGGPSAAADPWGVNLAARVQDGDEIHVPRAGEQAARVRLRSAAGVRGRRPLRRTTSTSIAPMRKRSAAFRASAAPSPLASWNCASVTVRTALWTSFSMPPA